VDVLHRWRAVITEVGVPQHDDSRHALFFQGDHAALVSVGRIQINSDVK
jgi:hypothetical protein